MPKKTLPMIAIFSSLMTVACTEAEPSQPGEPSEPTEPTTTASFANATDRQVERILASASDAEFEAASTLAVLFGEPEEGCPKVVVEGRRKIITGGCTSLGLALSGTMVLENMLLSAGYDGALPTKMSFDQFSYTPEGQTASVELNGSVTITPSGSMVETVAEISLTLEADTSTVRLNRSCDKDEKCTNSRHDVSLESLGSASVSGTFVSDSDPVKSSGIVVVRGSDELIFNLDTDRKQDESRCVDYTGAKSGTTCLKTN